MTSKKYDNYTKEELINELEALKKKKYGLVWDKKNSQEMLDAFVNWENVPENFAPKKFPVLKEVKNKEIENGKDKNRRRKAKNFLVGLLYLWTNNGDITIIQNMNTIQTI